MSRFCCCLLLAVGSMLAACSPPTADPTTTSSPANSTSDGAITDTTVSSPPTSLEATEPGDLLVIGDWGSGTAAQGAVAAEMMRYSEQNEIGAILTTGDNFYTDDSHLLMEPYGWASESSIPFWIVWGNHDVESERRVNSVNHAFDDPPRWAVYQWGQVDVIVLDSTQITSPQQAIFFLNAMSASERPTIVAMHHPPYSCAHYESTTELVDQVVEILDDDVFLVLSGHEHVYQRFEKDGVAYVVTGGGGATTHELSECPANHPEPLAGESIHHFLAIEQTDSGIEITAIDVMGEMFDEFELQLP